jgi:preprotein translocase SecE subunit
LYQDNSEGAARIRKWFTALLAYLSDVRREIKDVSFPAWREIRSTTITVMIVVLAVAAYVYVVDQICIRLLDQMFLQQR